MIAIFDEAELALLRREAEDAAATMKRLGLRGLTYEERRLEFALECNRENVFDRPKVKKWIRQIKIELETLRASAAGARCTTSAGAGKSGRGYSR